MLVGQSALTSHQGGTDEYTPTGSKMYTRGVADATRIEPLARPEQHQCVSLRVRMHQ
jgi:hypothetical protein